MAISIQYKSLFQLELLHHYFLSGGPDNKEFGAMTDEEKAGQLKNYRLANFLTLQPDQTTANLMKGLKQIYRNTGTGFQVLASVDGDDRPVMSLEEGMKWTFGILINDPQFWNFTALRLTPGFDLNDAERNNVPRVFYYSNTGQNITAPNLSTDIDDFSNAVTYQMNDLAIHNGNLYEAEVHDPPGATPLVANSGWREINQQPFGTHVDELRWRPTYFKYKFTAADVWARIVLTDRNGNTVFEDYFMSRSDNLYYAFDLSPYSPGRYRLAVTGNGYTDSQEFYYHPDFRGKSLFGVIEIIHEAGLSSGLRLLDNDGKVVGQGFELRYKNRLTQWRYKDSTDQTVIANVDGTDNALPLTYTGFVDSVEINGKKLPNPSADMIKTETDAIYSDVFIDASQYP